MLRGQKWARGATVGAAGALAGAVSARPAAEDVSVIVYPSEAPVGRGVPDATDSCVEGRPAVCTNETLLEGP